MSRRFRFFASRDTDPGHPSDGIERQRRLRIRRTLLGLYIDAHAGAVQGSVVAAVGSGRWSRYEPGASAVWPIPTSLLNPFRVTEIRRWPLSDVLGAAADLSDWLADRAVELVNRGGDDDDDLLAVCLHDDGWSFPDFDGTPRFVSRAAPERLAERCGWPVISQLRDADVAAGGRGDPIDPLALWFLLADRNERVAESSRLVVRLGERADTIFLPASDGLDAEHPPIDRSELWAWPMMVRAIADQFANPGNSSTLPLGTLGVQGRVGQEWLECFERERDSVDARRLSALAGASKMTTADMARTCVHWLVENVRWLVLRPRHEVPPIDRLMLIGSGSGDGYLHQSLRQRIPGITIEVLDQQTTWQSSTLDATLTGVLGFLHVDQQPASLPMLTGADVPRLHGRLVPGHLAAWRRLLVEMADFRPPPMKLREAV